MPPVQNVNGVSGSKGKTRKNTMHTAAADGGRNEQETGIPGWPDVAGENARGLAVRDWRWSHANEVDTCVETRCKKGLLLVQNWLI